MMKKTICVICFIYLCNLCFAQIVNIPDANFKNYLINNSSINTNGDAEIQVAEATAYTGKIIVPFLNISSLTGIEAFTDITELECEANSLTSMNVSFNTALTHLGFQGNQLTSLNISANTALTQLFCQNNQLINLDVSTNTALTILSCFNNQLMSLNVKNGNNTNFTNFIATNNPNLTCIEVDDTAYMNANWAWSKDTTAIFSENCGTGVNEIQHSTFNIQHFPNPFSSSFTISYSLAETGFVSLKLFDVTGKLISLIANENQTKGEHTVNYDGKNSAEGIYYYQLITDKGTETKKIVKN